MGLYGNTPDDASDNIIAIVQEGINNGSIDVGSASGGGSTGGPGSGGGGGNTPPALPNNTTFASAEVPATGGGNHILVTLSDNKGYASVSSEWMVTINGVNAPDIGASGHGTTEFNIHVGPNGTIGKGDTVKVSHLVADSGIVKFTNQAVTNNLN